MRVLCLQTIIDFLRGKKINLFDLIKAYINYIKAVRFVKNVPKYKAIFKFDDLTDTAKPVLELDKYIKNEQLKVCWGIIGNSLENAKPDYIKFIKNNNGKNYSFFNHGYLHIDGEEYEFCNKNSEEQYASLIKTQDIVLKRTGIKLNSFGAPCNHIDDNTKDALEKISDIKYWFYGKDSFSKINIHRFIEMENGVGNPDFSYFVKNLKNLSDNVKLFTLQGHPYIWNLTQKFNFRLIVKFLKDASCEFILPEEIGEINA